MKHLSSRTLILKSLCISSWNQKLSPIVKLFSITQKPPGNELSTDLRTPDQAGWPTNNSQGTTFSGNFKITENCSGLKVYFKEPVNLIEIRSCQNMFSKRFLSPFPHCSSKNSRCYTTGCEHLNQVILAIARGDPSSKEILHCPSSFHSW